MVDVQPVDRRWPDSTVVCLGSGPSLTAADVDYCRGRAHVIAIKDTYHLAPWADVLYSGDEVWWTKVGPSLTFDGYRVGLCAPSPRFIEALEQAGAHRLLIGDALRLETDPRKLATGHHSGFQAINLAMHLGASRIVLLGYDMQAAADGRVNFAPATYKKKAPPFQWLDVFRALPARLEELGVRVINATRSTALTVFPQMSLAEALA